MNKEQQNTLTAYASWTMYVLSTDQSGNKMVRLPNRMVCLQ